MSGTKFKIIKQCLMCGNLFEAQKTTTKYCSHICNSRHYKLRVRLAKRKEVEDSLQQSVRTIHLKLSKDEYLNLEKIRLKEYLTVREAAMVFHCNIKTVYKMLHTQKIACFKFSTRKTLIRKNDIDKLFK